MTLPILIVEKPYLPPFNCGRCNAAEGTRDFFVDFGIDMELVSHADGRLYICDKCMEDIATSVPGLFIKSQVDSLIGIQQAAVSQAKKSFEEWTDKVEKFKSIGIDLEKVWEQLNGRNDIESIQDNLGSTEVDRDVSEPKLTLNPLLSFTA